MPFAPLAKVPQLSVMEFGAIFLQASSNPLPHLNKMAHDVTYYVSFETVKDRQRPGQTIKLASATEKDSDEENSEKGSGLFDFPERGGGGGVSSPSSNVRRLKNS